MLRKFTSEVTKIVAEKNICSREAWTSAKIVRQMIFLQTVKLCPRTYMESLTPPFIDAVCTGKIFWLSIVFTSHEFVCDLGDIDQSVVCVQRVCGESEDNIANLC
jgi:hypothetical protein